MHYFIFILLASIGIYGCTYSNAKSDDRQISENNISRIIDTSTLNKYSWISDYNIKNSIINRISAPEGYTREKVTAGSFGDWLRHIPLKPGNPEVHLFNGKLKNYQEGHFAVVDIDAGTGDLQQCAVRLCG